MKTINRAIAAAALAATALTAVVSAAQAETVLRLDEVPVGELDPAKASDYADSILMFNVYDTLVFAGQGKPGMVPDLASSWETDGTSFTFKLRDDVKFQSGNPFTSADVVYSLERMKALGQGLSYLFEDVTGAEAVDEHTVKFTLAKPYAPFLAALVRLPIVDKKLVEENTTGDDWGQAYLSTHSAGTGAYSVTSHNPQSETVMAKNPSYFQEMDAAAPDTVRLRYGLEAATVRTLVAQGEHDITSQWLPPEVLASLAKEGNQLLTEHGNGAFYIKLNTAKAPFDDVNCRLAVSNAFDYQSALKLIAVTPEVSQGKVPTGAIPAQMLGGFPDGEPLKQDLAKAKEFLSQCKYNPADTEVEISWIAEVPIEERFALLLQANMQQLGFKSKITKMPWALFVDAVTKPESTPNVSQVNVASVTGDPDTLLYGMYHSSAAGTWQSPEYLKDEEVDKLLDQGRAATSEEERAAAYTALNKRLMEIAPSIYAYDSQAVFAASNRVKVPALSDDSKRISLDSAGFQFRLMEMQP
ncbi:ABC transporter substrate-binding protein [Paradevosia shaoguanensis]|uniref:ABC transporter substrate-binding protein n=1 Tax=Paradevosia shaoguanensis TaxID=1335043 RepID=UPI001932F453|nr:ABC transporter substrate-binding protein [Paradevosia shaoguanensis]